MQTCLRCLREAAHGTGGEAPARGTAPAGAGAHALRVEAHMAREAAASGAGQGCLQPAREAAGWAEGRQRWRKLAYGRFGLETTFPKHPKHQP